MKELSILTHTHTDCSDVLDIYLDSYNKFCDSLKHYYLINKTNKNLKNQIVYNEKLRYVDRLLKAFNSRRPKISTKYVIIDFEDMILYNHIQHEELSHIISIMDDGDIAFTRLIKSGIKDKPIKFSDNLFWIGKRDLQLSLTPTIWNLELLKEKLELFKGKHIWDLEKGSHILGKHDNWNGLYYYGGERKIGGHFDSDIYPHICSAIYKGKWNSKDYAKEIKRFSEEYQIDLSKRGFHGKRIK